MKRNLIKLLVLLIAVFVAPIAFAAGTVVKTCQYEYWSETYGYSAAQMKIYTKGHYSKDWSGNYKPGFHDGTVLFFNGEKITWDPNEDVHDYSGYVNQMLSTDDPVCPYFMAIDGGGNLYLEASYSKEGIHDSNDNHEMHIACSKTIEQDMPNYDPSMCDDKNHEQDDRDSQLDNKRTKLYSCSYSKTTQWGFSSATLYIYDDYKNKEKDGIINVFNDDDFDNNNNHIKLKNWDNLVPQIKEKKTCPYYMVIDKAGWNDMEAGYDKEDLKNRWGTDTKDTQLLVSTDIAEDKEDYNEEEDGAPVRKEDEQQRAEDRKTGSEVRAGLDDDWNPDDPYGFHVGDSFCGEPRVITALKALGVFIIIARFAVPILVIIFGSKDFIETIISGKEESLKADAKKLGLRVVVGLFVFFAPTIANAFFNGLNRYQVISDQVNQCQNCLLNPFNEAYCVEGKDAPGSTNANTKSVNASNIATTRNAGVDASKVDANTPGVDSNNITTTRVAGVDASKIDPNTPNVNTSDGNNNKNVVVVEEPSSSVQRN